MARQTAISINTIPIGPLGIIGMPGCEELTDKIDKYLVKWRKTQASEHAESIAFFGYQRDTFSTVATMWTLISWTAPARALAAAKARVLLTKA